MVQTLRIFISSPGDVAEERELARKVVQQLRRLYVGRLDLKTVLWEDLPLAADMSFQQGIDLVLSQQGVDIAVFILWSRLGTPTGPLVQRSDGTSYRSGTEREFDLMLAARRQSEGQRPQILVYTRDDETSFEERLRGRTTDEKNDFLRQKSLVERFIREEFHDAERQTNVRAYHTFDRPVTFSQRLRVHLEAMLDQLTGSDQTQPLWDIDESGPPFLGLEAYQFHHAPIFFGREDEIVGIRQALRDQACRGCAFLLIAGASGAGKSSLARAGVLPAIVEHELDETIDSWRHAELTPGTESGDLVAGLARKLAQALPELETGPDAVQELAEGLAKDPALTYKLRIKDALARASAGKSGAVRLILLVDQLEELFTDSEISDASRASFAAALEALARSGGVWVLANMRSDFLHHCQSVPALVRLRSGAGHWDLLPPEPDALGRLIRQPAKLAGLAFEAHGAKSLADRIQSDATAHRELLPLLSHVLRELCARRTEQGLLTSSAYEEVGGLAGALARHADTVFSALPAEVQNALPALLTRLVTLGGDDQASFVRQHPRLADLTVDPATRKLVDAFIAARLLTASGGSDDSSATVTLAHEVLLRVWEPARDWTRANREHLQLRARVEQSQARWESSSPNPTNRDPSLLLPPGLPLEEGRTLLADAPHLLLPGTSQYIETSIRHVEAQQRRRTRVRRVVTAALAMLAAVAVVGGLVAGWQSREAARQAEKAREAQAIAEKSAGEAKRQSVIAQRAQVVAETNAKEARSATRAAQSSTEQARAAQLIAVREREQANQQRDRAERLLYAHLISRAQKDWENGEAGSAWEILDACQPTLRGWEHDYLYTLFTRGLLTLRGHTDDVRGVAFSPDGTRIASASWDDTARVWDAATGREILTFKGHSDNVNGVAFSPDGRRVASASDDDTVKVWDAASGQETLTLRKSSMVLSVAFSPDGTRIASASRDSSVNVWDVATGQQTLTLKGHQGPMRSVAFSPDGSRIASGGDDRLVKVWDAASGQEIYSLEGHTLGIEGVAFSDDGTRIASASYDETIKIWDAATGKEIRTLKGRSSFLFCVAFSSDGKRIAAGGLDSAVRVWDVASGQETYTLEGHANTVRGVAFSPDGKRIASASDDYMIKVWNADAGPQSLTHNIKHTDDVLCAAFSPDGRRVVSGSYDDTVKVWDAVTGQEILTFRGHQGDVRGVAFSPDGTRIASASYDRTVKIWDAGTGQETLTLRGIGDWINVAFSHDGSRIAAAPREGAVSMWDAATGKEALALKGHSDQVTCVAFSHDGSRIATASKDRTVKLWDAATGRETHTLSGHTDQVACVAFSGEGRQVISGSFDRTLKIWDAATGKELLTLKGNSDEVTSLALSPDGRRIVSGSRNLKVWDSATGQETITLKGQTGAVFGLAFSPDGRRIMSASTNNTVRIWDASRRAK